MNKKLWINLGIAVVLVIFYVIINNRIDDKRLKTVNSVLDDTRRWCSQVEKIEYANGKLTVFGFFFEINSEKDKGWEPTAILKNLKNDTVQVMKSSLVERPDVNDEFKCERNYSYSGFKAECSLSKEDYDNGAFEILIKQDKKVNTAVTTRCYLEKGELRYVKNYDYAISQLKEKDKLGDIVSKGSLLLYKEDQGLWIYQLENNLYWIADNRYNFSPDGATNVQIHVYTTQPGLLPEVRRRGGWNWDNISKVFEENEITEVLKLTEYRVSTREIPSEYSVTSFIVGIYDSEAGWKWQEEIRPVFNLD